jgi:hypothetical protein
VAALPPQWRRQQEQLSSGLKFKVIQSKFSELSMLSEQRGYSFDGGGGGGGNGAPCFRGFAWMAAAAALAVAAAAVLGSLAEGFHVSVSWLDFSYTRDESSRLNSRTAACRV